jgi:hypothetical protein
MKRLPIEESCFMSFMCNYICKTVNREGKCFSVHLVHLFISLTFHRVLIHIEKEKIMTRSTETIVKLLNCNH